MNEKAIQSARYVRWRVARTIFQEAGLVLVAGVVFAFAANWISPRGLALTRNYFPAVTRHPGPVPTVAAGSRLTPGTNSPAPLLVARGQEPGLQMVDGHQAVRLFHDARYQRNRIVFIDARDESHYREGHIPGAGLFDPYHPEKYFAVVLPLCRAAEQIVVYCNGGDCDDSQSAAILLREVGIPNGKLFVYGGGITEWRVNGLPLETGGPNAGSPPDK